MTQREVLDGALRLLGQLSEVVSVMRTAMESNLKGQVAAWEAEEVRYQAHEDRIIRLEQIVSHLREKAESPYR